MKFCVLFSRRRKKEKSCIRETLNHLMLADSNIDKKIKYEERKIIVSQVTSPVACSPANSPTYRVCCFAMTDILVLGTQPIYQKPAKLFTKKKGGLLVLQF